MYIWNVTLYEPLPIGGEGVRPMRSYMLSRAFCDAGHDVELWVPGFEHLHHEHIQTGSALVRIDERFDVQYIAGCGYSNDLSPKRLVHNRQIAREFLRLARARNALPGLIITQVPALELAEAVTTFAAENKIPVVVDIRDLWPDVYRRLFPKWCRFLYHFIFFREILRVRRLLARATAITAVSDTFLRWGIDHSGRPETEYDRCFHIGYPSNGFLSPSTDSVRTFSSEHAIETESMVVTFVGTFGSYDDLNTVLKAADRLACNGVADVQFVIAGKGEGEADIRAKASLMSNVNFVGWLDREALMTLLSVTDVGIVSYSADALQSMPNKPFEYMAASLPMLSSLDGELRRLVEENDIGRYYEAGDVSGLISEIMRFRDDPQLRRSMGDRGRKLYECEFNSDVIYPQFVSHVLSMCSNQGVDDPARARKLKEIEHSRQRRKILQGYERCVDTHAATQVDDLDALVKDPQAFKRYFANMKYYSVTLLSDQYQRDWVKARCNETTKVLDFACGNGETAIHASLCGGNCIGIDISPEGIDNARKNADAAGVSSHCKFEVMDGESMTFEDNTFDLCVEYGALHHVDLDAALSELNRVLKADGEMICVEALRHNPLIHWYRKRTPHLRTEWEVDHILGVESLEVMEKYFKHVEVRFFHLAALLAVPFRKTFLFKPLLAVLNLVDRILLSNRTIGKYGWIMVAELAQPVSPPGSSPASVKAPRRR